MPNRADKRSLGAVANRTFQVPLRHASTGNASTIVCAMRPQAITRSLRTMVPAA